jgi:hypothetical protein
MLNDTTLAIAPVPAISLENALVELDQFFTQPSKTLSDFVTSVAINGGISFFKQPVQAVPVFRTSDTSGFNYSFEKKMVAYLRFGTTTSGYFVVQSMIVKQNSGWVSHYYSADGKYAFSEGPITHTFAPHSELLMEANCPVINHLYNIAADGYADTASGKVNTKRVHAIEQILRRLEKTRKNELSLSLGFKDEAISTLNRKMMSVEMDPVYTWKERYAIFKVIKEERRTVIRTKRRAHKKSILKYSLPIITHDLQASFERFTKRPFSNSLGILDRILLDPLRWFGGVVKDNMGYSIALAIYSPFTFFFITQPMNPQAMWAVGKVRSAYIETTDAVKNVFSAPETKMISSSALATGTQAAGAAGTAAVAASFLPQNNGPVKPGQFGLLLSGEQPDVNNQSWDDRMSNFKALQIAYEGNMEIAPRIGRLEQMETQLNWPLIIESTWLETERYMDFLNFVLSNSKDYAPQFVEYMQNEKGRTEQVQLYLWDRNVRFILDHPYTMQDQSKEQTQSDYYVGRAFINLRDMTANLAQRFKGLPIPAGFESITQLANHFEQDYKKGGSVLDRLKNNSKLFAQDDKTSTKELRSYMQRQWEVLYLLQNKAQEGANNGLQLYVWSVRNTAYLLQSLYSSKREEASVLSLSFKKGAIVNKLSANPSFKKVDSQFESIFHMMVLEYTSIRKEIGEALKKDIESTQRKKIIDGVESFLKERDSLLKGANLL